MKYVNQMIVALFLRNKDTMKYSNGRTILFIAKLTFTLLPFIWLLFVALIVERNFDQVVIISRLPKGRLAYIAILLPLYFVVNHFTWKVSEVEAYISDESNYHEIKKATWLFYSLLITSIILSVSMALYNKWYPSQYYK